MSRCLFLSTFFKSNYQGKWTSKYLGYEAEKSNDLLSKLTKILIPRSVYDPAESALGNGQMGNAVSK